jgi:calcyphosin
MDYKEFANIFLEGKDANKDGAEATAQDPYLQEKARREAASAKARGDNPEALLALFKDKLKARGARGMVGLRRLFNMMDDDGSQTLSMPEFGKCCKDFKIGVSEENVPILFSLFDRNGDGTLDYDEFIAAVRKPLPDNRAKLVDQAFDLLSDGGALIEMDDIKKIYTANASRHPDVI